MSKKEKDAAKKAKNLKQQENKTPELAAAKKAFEQYFKDNNLDPTKDYTKDPKHGKKVTKLLSKLNKERDKVAALYPESDKGAMEHLKKKAEKKAKNEAKVDKLQKELKKEKAAKEHKATKYDYPLIDGREMTSAEKKKYRMEQRKLKAGAAPKENQTSAEPKKSKKKDKVAKEAAPEVKKDKKKKKVHKEED